jgi:hypothetical protein
MLFLPLFCRHLQSISPDNLDDTIYTQGVSIVTGIAGFQDARFISCHASERGGGIRVEATATSCRILRCTFTSCNAPTGGGVCIDQLPEAIVFDCTFISCTATASSGALYLRPTRCHVSGFVGRQCSASERCAFVYAASATSGLFEMNETSGIGGRTQQSSFSAVPSGLETTVIASLNSTANEVEFGGSGIEVRGGYFGYLFWYSILRGSTGPSPFLAFLYLEEAWVECLEVTGNHLPDSRAALYPGVIYVYQQADEEGADFWNCLFAGNDYDIFMARSATSDYALNLRDCIFDGPLVFATAGLTLRTRGATMGDHQLYLAYCPTRSPTKSPSRSATMTPARSQTVSQSPEPSETPPPSLEAAESGEASKRPEQTWPLEVEVVAPWKAVRYALVIIGVLLAVALASMATINLQELLRFGSVSAEASDSARK